MVVGAGMRSGVIVARAACVVTMVVTVAAIAVAAAGLLGGGMHRSPAARAATGHTAAIAGGTLTTGVDRVAAAYAAPLGCLGRTIGGGGSALADIRPDRTSPCWHYGVYVTAIFGQVHGVWRLMLQATSPNCPAVRLPAIVRSASVICKRPAGPSPTRRLRNIP